jgi:hypothetical protein
MTAKSYGGRRQRVTAADGKSYIAADGKELQRPTAKSKELRRLTAKSYGG